MSNFAVVLCPTLAYVAALSVHLLGGNIYIFFSFLVFSCNVDCYFVHFELLCFAIWLTRMQYTATALRTCHL